MTTLHPLTSESTHSELCHPFLNTWLPTLAHDFPQTGMTLCHLHPLLHRHYALSANSYGSSYANVLANLSPVRPFRACCSILTKLLGLKETEGHWKVFNGRVTVIRFADLKDHLGCYGEQEQMKRDHLESYWGNPGSDVRDDSGFN